MNYYCYHYEIDVVHHDHLQHVYQQPDVVHVPYYCAVMRFGGGDVVFAAAAVDVDVHPIHLNPFDYVDTVMVEVSDNHFDNIPVKITKTNNTPLIRIHRS